MAGIRHLLILAALVGCAFPALLKTISGTSVSHLRRFGFLSFDKAQLPSIDRQSHGGNQHHSVYRLLGVRIYLHQNQAIVERGDNQGPESRILSTADSAGERDPADRDSRHRRKENVT